TPRACPTPGSPSPMTTARSTARGTSSWSSCSANPCPSCSRANPCCPSTGSCRSSPRPRALHAAHLAGVVHRDIKPGNILLGRSGRVKITDFGVSLATNQISLTATGMVMGTAQYLSPEQALGRPATPSSDIYSLGVVAYEALAGKRPFTGESAVDIAVAHVNRPVPPLPRQVDACMAELVMRMLSKDPADRPRSAASLARMFDEMVAETPPRGVAVVPGTIITPGLAAQSVPTTASPPEPAPAVSPLEPAPAVSPLEPAPDEPVVVAPSEPV